MKSMKNVSKVSGSRGWCPDAGNEVDLVPFDRHAGALKIFVPSPRTSGLNTAQIRAEGSRGP